MGVRITCIDPATGQPATFEANSISMGGGGSDAKFPNLLAQRINLSMVDVQNTIAEGRAHGIKPFNLIGSPNDIQRGALSPI